jgi:hypothetical protein
VQQHADADQADADDDAQQLAPVVGEAPPDGPGSQEVF